MIPSLFLKLGQPSVFLWLIVPFFIAQVIVYTSPTSKAYFKHRYMETGNTSWAEPHVRYVWLFSIAVCSMLTLEFLVDVYNRTSHRLQYLGKIETVLRLIFIFQVGLSALCLFMFARKRDVAQLMALSQLFHNSSLVSLLTSFALTKSVNLGTSNIPIFAFYWLNFYITLAVLAVGTIFVPYMRFIAPTYSVYESVFEQLHEPRIMAFFFFSVYTTLWVIAVYVYKVYTLTLRALHLRRRFFMDDMEVLVLVCGALQFTTNFLQNGIHASEASPLICNFSPMLCTFTTQTALDLKLYYGMWCAWAVLFAVVPKQVNLYRTRTANAEIVGAKQALERLLEEYASESDSGEGLIGGVQGGSVTKLQDVVASCGRAIAMLQRVADVDAETASVSSASPPRGRVFGQQSSSWREHLSSISHASTDNNYRHRVHADGFTAADDDVDADLRASQAAAADADAHAAAIGSLDLEATSAASRADVELSVGGSAVPLPSVDASSLSRSSTSWQFSAASAGAPPSVSSISNGSHLWQTWSWGFFTVASRNRGCSESVEQVGAANGGYVDPVGRMLMQQEAS